MPKPLSHLTERYEPVIVWLVLCSIVSGTKLLIAGLFPIGFADPDQAALLQWPALVVFFSLGAVGVLLADRCGFPVPWSRVARSGMADVGKRFTPAAVGAAFGAGMVLLDYATGLSRLIAAHHNVTQQYTGFVPMFLVFVVAAPVIVEVVYRLFLFPVLLWLISTVILRGREQQKTFYVLAIVLSALEPFTQTPDLRQLPVGLWVADALLLYGLNLTQVFYFRKAGYVASILVRAGFYLVWHVLYIH
jgi:hypothetical protein